MAGAVAATSDIINNQMLIRHPDHAHPLESLDLSILQRSIPSSCNLCRRKIYSNAFACHSCQFYCHKACGEAPSEIEGHPLHPLHPLTLAHIERLFICDGCGESFRFGGTSFSCRECDFDLDLSCALSTLSDLGGPSQRKTPEQIYHTLHPHSLTSFSSGHDFFGGTDCCICQEHVEEDGYFCLRRSCDILIHKSCIQDLYFVDGAKAPRVYHSHPLETLIAGKETDPMNCAKCGADKLGEFIGCARCSVFIHRDCIPGKDILQYPPHPGHSLVLFINRPDNNELQCRSCFSSLGGELCFRCFSCKFFVHVDCALQTLDYCEKGMRLEIEFLWHDHPLLLCHKTNSFSDHCFSCGDKLKGPTYMCKVQDCGFLIHGECTEPYSLEKSPCHPYHPITVRKATEGDAPHCEACRRIIVGVFFSCELCAFYFHLACADRAPTEKHYLHQHKLLRFDELASLECNRCGLSTDSPTFRCVPCNFNLHEKCMELPPVVKHETHFHPLTLRDRYVDDDSGEYYCDRCGTRRDDRLGVYVCQQCNSTLAFHLECVLPELQKVYVKKGQTSVIKSLEVDIKRKSGKVRATKEKLEEGKRELEELNQELAELNRELEELVKKHGKLISEQENK